MLENKQKPLTTEEFDTFMEKGFSLREFVKATIEYDITELIDDRKLDGEDIDMTDHEISHYNILDQDQKVIHKNIDPDNLAEHIRKYI